MGADRASSAWAGGAAGSKRRRQPAVCGCVLWQARGASPWRDLPPELGKWTSVHARFRRWALAGVWERLFKRLAEEPDFEYVFVDSTICKVHADATGAKGGLSLRASAGHGAA